MFPIPPPLSHYFLFFIHLRESSSSVGGFHALCGSTLTFPGFFFLELLVVSGPFRFLILFPVSAGMLSGFSFYKRDLYWQLYLHFYSVL